MVLVCCVWSKSLFGLSFFAGLGSICLNRLRRNLFLTPVGVRLVLSVSLTAPSGQSSEAD